MLNDMLKAVYMRVCQQKCRADKLNNQLIYLASFPQNNNGWIEQLFEQVDIANIYYAYTDSLKEEALLFLKSHPDIHGLPLNYSYDFFNHTLPTLAASQFIIADNYFPFLAALPHMEKRKVVQIWHADGAIKKFGLQDPKNSERSACDNQRFKDVYKTFTDYFVASELMGDIFQQSYGAEPNQIHLSGFPRSDYLVNELSTVGKTLFLAKNPQYKGKKILLYAPTYRENKEEKYPFEAQWFERFDDVIVIERYHPHSSVPSTPIEGSYEELLAATDILITDYSSIPFDYSLVSCDGSIIFYQYDQCEYKKRYGLQPSFMENIPGPVVKNSRELLKQVESILQQPHAKSLEDFNDEWNTYNDGQATRRLALWLNKQ